MSREAASRFSMLLDLQRRRFTQILEGTRESRPLNGPTGSGGDIRRGHHRKRSQTNPNAWNNFATQTGLQDVTTNPLDDSIPPWAFARLVIRFDSIKMWIRSIIGVNESLGNRR